jgi:enterochelin esterase-like enzyme
LLHGGGTDETQWPAIGLATVADRLILAGEIPPIIVVMPSSGISAGDATVVGVVLPWADANLPTLATKADRAVGGISLGGGAALELVALHPDLFARVGGHSPAVHTSQKLLDGVAKWGGPVWFDVGQSDGLRPLTQMLAADLSARGDKPELQVWPGQHNRAYWGSHVADYLRFYTAGWKGAAAPSPGGAP